MDAPRRAFFTVVFGLVCTNPVASRVQRMHLLFFMCLFNQCTGVEFEFHVAATAESEQPIEFTYTGSTGPNNWGGLSSNFSMCRSGKLQSPINILTSDAELNRKLKPLIASYDAANVTLVNNQFNVGVRYPDDAGSLIVDDTMYKLKQMHWHIPSEHTLDGQRLAAELHLVHVASDGRVSVVAILFEYGRPDPLLAKMQNKLKELANEAKLHDDTPVVLRLFWPTEIRKRSRKYYRYVGSFTTPPCTQGVIWNILGKVRSISREQTDILRAPLDMRCKNNARPCQQLNGRHVEVYDEDVMVH